MNIVLKTWLAAESKSDFAFAAVNYEERRAWDDSTVENLGHIISDNTTDPDHLKYIAEKLGWNLDKCSEYVRKWQPISSDLRKGKFGELLCGQILQEFHGYVIPVKKFRYQHAPGQSLPGTDIIAFKIKDNKISEMCMMEAKLRTQHDSRAILGAYGQLDARKKGQILPSIKFLLHRLYEINRNMFDMIAEYGVEINPNDTYRIGAVYEKSHWNEHYLEKLSDIMEESDIALTVDAVQITNLEKLVECTYENLGRRNDKAN